MKPILTVLVVLMMWGPPRLRLDPRPLNVALDSPFELDYSALFHVVLWLSAAVTIAVILGGRGLAGKTIIPRLIWRSSLKAFLLYGLLALASASYSVSPVYTIFFAGKVIISVFAVALLVDRDDLSASTPKILRLFMMASLGEWILNTGLWIVDPRMAGTELPNIGYRLAGGFFEDYGIPAAMAGLYFLTAAVFYRSGLTRFGAWVFYLLTWVFVIMSRTRSSIIGAAVMLMLLAALHHNRNARLFAGVLFGLTCAAVVGAQWMDPIVEFGMRGQNMDSLLTLTGRANAFEFLINTWKESPWIGIGYAAGSRFALMQFVKDSGLGMGSAHDAISKVLVEMGVIGTAVLTFIFLAIWRETIKLVSITKNDREMRPLAIQLVLLLSYFTLNSLVSAGIAEAPYPFLIVSACSAIVRDRISSRNVVTQANQGVVLTPCEIT